MPGKLRSTSAIASSSTPAARAAAVAAAAFARLWRAAHQRLGGKRIIRAELDPGEPEARRNDRDTGTLEDAQLRRPIGLEAPVTVEMVGLDVEEHGDLAAEGMHVLELEARELADRPRRRRATAESGCRCFRRPRPRVPSRAEDRSEELARRRLAVRPGDPDEARPEGASRLQPSSSSDHTAIPSERARGRAALQPARRVIYEQLDPSRSARSSRLRAYGRRARPRPRAPRAARAAAVPDRASP